VRDQNLYIKPLTGGTEKALTTEGKDALSFGTAEFVAQEEMDRFTGYWWNPNETSIAYTRVDESTVDVVPRADIGPGGATVVEQRYPRAGRPNAVVDLFVQDLATGKVVQIDLGPNKDIYVARVDWSADGKTLYVQRQTRDQKTVELIAYDPAKGTGKTILTETDAHWIELNDDFHPLKDGSFLWSSEKSGYNHLYHYAGGGKLIAQVTQGDWPINALEGVDEVRKVAIFTASIDTPLERRIYEVSYAKPGKPKALTPAGGWWTAKVAEAGNAFTAGYSDPKTPPQTALYDATGKRVRWIEENRLDANHPYGPYAATLPVPEYGTLKASDGEVLHYEILKPIGFDPAKKYPAIVSVYGGRARPDRQPLVAEGRRASVPRGRLRHLQAGQPRQQQPLGQVQAGARPPHGHGRGRGPVGRRQVPGGPSLCRSRQLGRHGLVVRRVHDPDADDRPGHPLQGRRLGRAADGMGPLRHPLHRAVHGQARREQGRLRQFRRAQSPEEPQAQQPAAAARHGRRQRHLRKQHPPDRGDAEERHSRSR
jgi:hypothetical protein